MHCDVRSLQLQVHTRKKFSSFRVLRCQLHDLRELTQSLQSVSDRVNQQGIGGTLGPAKLPDYKPRKH